MKEVVLLPMGDQSHIDSLLDRLGDLVEAGREEEFALLLPFAHLLHEYRLRLVRRAARRLNLLTFDDLVAAALEIANPGIQELDEATATEIIIEIMARRAGDLPGLGRYAGSRGMARELNYALGQLRRAGVTPSQLTGALKANPDPVLSDVLIIWQDYQAFMRAKGLADIEEQYALAAATLAGIPWLKEVREFHICWFLDFEPLQLAIVDKLPAGADITVWVPFKHPAHDQYLANTIQSLEKRGFAVRSQAGFTTAMTENLFLPTPQPCPAPKVHGLAAPRLRQELELVARKIKGLTCVGASPEDICLVVPDQRKYLPPLRHLYREHGIELAAPLVVDLMAVPWVREVLALWQAAASGWDRESLLTLAGCAYLRAHLPSDYDGDAMAQAVVGLGGNLRGQGWLAALDREVRRLTRQMKEEEAWENRSEQRLLEVYRAARPGLQAWLELGARVKDLTPQEHCRLLGALAEANAQRIAPMGDGEEDIRDRAALTKVLAAVQGYQACCKLLQRTAPISPGRFLEEFSPWLEQGLSLERSNPGAARVFSPAQVRGLRCKYLFILGLNQGTFPRPAREHWLLDRVAELPGLESVSRQSLAQEKIFFHSCVASVQDCLYLSRLLPGIEEEAEASPFWQEIDALMAGGMPQEFVDSSDLLPPLQPEAITSPGQLRQSMLNGLARGRDVSGPALAWLRGRPEYVDLHVASQVEQRREGPLPPDNMDGVLAHRGPAKAGVGEAVYSISRLEQYVRCPFSYFARYCLGLEPAPGEVPEYSVLDRGSFLHWLLEKFYTQHLEQANLNKPETIRTPLTALAQQWLAEQGGDSQDILWRLRLRDAINMVQGLIEADLPWLQETGLRPVLFEASFGLPGSPVGPVRPGEGPVRFRGKIDRIDVLEREGETWAVVYDYKTSREITRIDIVEGRSLQIPVYLSAAPALLARLGYDNVRVMGGGYYVIKGAKLAGGIWNQEFTAWANKRLASLEPKEFRDLERALAERAGDLHQSILAGNFAPNPEPLACTYCEYRRCCRYEKNRFNLKRGGGIDAAQR